MSLKTLKILFHNRIATGPLMALLSDVSFCDKMQYKLHDMTQCQRSLCGWIHTYRNM